MMKSILSLSSFLLMCILSLPLLAADKSADENKGIAIIVNVDNHNDLDMLELRRIYLGKSRAFPDGLEAAPLDQSAGSAIRVEFARKVLKKNEGNLNAYWARMLFSSKAAPPKMIGDVEEIKAVVARDKRMIAYIDADDVDKSVRVLMIIP